MNDGIVADDSIEVCSEPPAVVPSKDNSHDVRPAEETVDVRVLAIIGWWLNSSSDGYHGKHQRC